MNDKIKQFKKDVTDEGETSIEEMRERAYLDLNWEGVSWGLEWLDKDFIREFKDLILWDFIGCWKNIDKNIIKEFSHEIEKALGHDIYERYVLNELRDKNE